MTGLIPGALIMAGVVGALSAISSSAAITAAVGAIAISAALIRPKIVIYGLVVTVFTEFLAVGGLTVSRLAAPIALVAVIAESVHAPLRLHRASWVLAFAGAYGFLALASLFWSLSPDGTLQQLGSLSIALVYMIAFAVLVRSEADLRRVFVIIAGCAAVLGLFWIGSYLAGIGRAGNPAGDPNFFAGDQVVAFSMVLVLAGFATKPSRSALLYLVVAIIAASIVASLSRSGILALGVALSMMLIVHRKILFRSRARKLTFFVAAALGLAIVLPIAGRALGNRFHEGVADSGARRRDLWLAAEDAYSQHPIFGIGYGAFKPTMYEWVIDTPTVRIADFSPSILQVGQPVHNAYLESLTELGPVGIVAFVGLILASVHSFYRTSRQAGRAGLAFLRSASAALVVGLLAFSITAIFLPTETSRTLWMFVGLSLALPSMLPQEGRSAALASGTDLTAIRTAAGRW